MPFSVLSDLGLGKLNPPIDETFTRDRLANLTSRIPFFDIKTVLASPSVRCQDTARLLLPHLHPDAQFTSVPQLAEVHFDLSKMDHTMRVEEKMSESGIAAVNTAVFEGMVEDSHCESAKSVYKRVTKVFESLQNIELPALCLSHDFFMRVIELYIQRKGAPYSQISAEELESTQRNGYLCGFVTNPSLASFTPIVD